FPFDQESGLDVPDGYGGEVASHLRTVLVGNPKYSVFLYSQRLSPIRRAWQDNSVESADIAPPFTEDRAKPLKLAQMLAADFYLVGMVDDYKFDPANKVAMMTLSAGLIDGKTGKLLGNFVVAGRADATSAATDAEEYRAVAAGKAIEALRDQVLPSAEAETEPAGETTSETTETTETTTSEAGPPEADSTPPGPAPTAPESDTTPPPDGASEGPPPAPGQ
ncbi:unnamed protein product, partial [marine sediment metagenome]